MPTWPTACYAGGMALRRSLLGSVLSASIALVGCAPDAPGGLTGTGGSGAGNSSGSGKGSGSDSSGTSQNNGSTGTGFSNATAATGSMMTCAAASIEAKITPLAMYIMFDKSGSMNDGGKWTAASSALKSFFQDPGAAGLEVALRFFPEGNCDGSTCDVNACATPKVDAGPLTADPAATDPQEKALVKAVNDTIPAGNTPMFAALKGAVKWAGDFQAANTDHKTVVILVTDGEPNGCITDTNQIANEAEVGFANGIMTFAIGLEGSNVNTINKIAAKGGSTEGFFIGNSGGTETALLAALEEIRGKAIACELQIPEPEMGELNPDKVNVTFTPGGGVEKTIGHVDDESQCGAASAWYYDDPQNPTRIILCPDTCEAVQGDDAATINIQLGCDTQPA